MKISASHLALAAGLLASAALLRLPLGPYYYDIAIGIGINIILAVSLNLVTGYTGQFSLGHAGFMAVGAYGATAIGNFLGPQILGPTPSLWMQAWFFPFALITGGACAAFAGLLVGIPSLRLRGDYLAIVTLGFGEIIRVIIQNTEVVGAARGWSVTYGFTNLFWTYAVCTVTIYVICSAVQSTYGSGFLAVRDDEIAAQAMGIDTTKYKVAAFVLGAFFAGMAGGLYAHFKQYINPAGFDFMKSVDVVVMVILGGMGSTPGVILAAVLLTILPEWLRTVAGWEFLPDWMREIARNRMILYSLLLIVLMLTRPQGLFGNWRRSKRAPVLAKRRKP